MGNCMLFSENYDKLFWLMLYGDKKNMDNLAYFIRIIPQEVFEYIRNQISNGTYNDNKIRCNMNDYLFEIHLDFTDGLNIKIWRWKGHSVQEKFEMLLNPLDLKRIDIFEKVHIGNFYCSIVDNNNIVNVSNNSKYVFANNKCYLIRIPFGYLLQVGDNLETSLKIVNYTRNYSGELNVHDFEDCVKVERLVRSRKK